ncbi:MAG: uroporphyrinogen decarboxylase family protein [Actinobacteria bacterium]|nr:uroporphyrinogen decarboxylase family protein [Actinomycetota bacterium]
MEELVFQYPLMKLGQFDLPEPIKDYSVDNKDKNVLRELADKKAEIASLSIQKEKIKLWKDLNSLKETRPLLWINEVPWHELNCNDELTLKTNSAFARFLETRLKRTLYLWKHMPVDSIIEPNIPCYFVIEDTGFGISEKVKIAKTDDKSEIYSREYTKQIKNEQDLEKIKIPKVIINKEETDKMFNSICSVFNGILKVEKRGMPGFWFAPWDELIRWWGVQDALSDMILRPDLVHKVMEKLTDAYLKQLDQYEEQGLLTLNNCNYRIGSGGLGYTDELPEKDYNPYHIVAKDLWGCGAAQIFSDVSPAMHEEFALNYEIRYMSRFGLNYYGCCEPLDKKIDILKKIPNLRKISISPWANLENAADKIGRKFVLSYKPNPSIFIDNNWDLDFMRKDLEKNLNKIKNCVVEVIIKDISTVKYKPERLWLWTNMATEVVRKFD